MSTQKFRPYFSSTELSEIISALKETPTPSRMALIRYLEGFVLKINHGVVTASHTLRPSLEEKLGFSDPPKLTYLKGVEAYNRWKENPSACYPQEIEEAMSYAYINDLLTTQQEKEYESLNRTT